MRTIKVTFFDDVFYISEKEVLEYWNVDIKETITSLELDDMIQDYIDDHISYTVLELYDMIQDYVD